MLQIVDPVALVLSAIDMNVDSLSVSLIVSPLAVIDVAIGMPELALAVSLVVEPVPLVLSAIGPYLHAVSMTLVSQPLASVNGSILKDMLLLENDILMARAILGYLSLVSSFILVGAVREVLSCPMTSVGGLYLDDLIFVFLKHFLKHPLS